MKTLIKSLKWIVNHDNNVINFIMIIILFFSFMVCLKFNQERKNFKISSLMVEGMVNKK